MICQYKIELQSKIKRERITTFSRENVRENNKKVIENNMRRKKVKKKKIVINTKSSNSFYVM